MPTSSPPHSHPQALQVLLWLENEELGVGPGGGSNSHAFLGLGVARFWNAPSLDSLAKSEWGLGHKCCYPGRLVPGQIGALCPPSGARPAVHDLTVPMAYVGSVIRRPSQLDVPPLTLPMGP